MVGKLHFFSFYIFFSFFFSSTVSYASVSLSTDCDEIILGQPCTLTATIKNVPKGFKDPVIKTPEGINIEKTGLYISSINGKSQTKFSYAVVFDELGTYILGPASIDHQAKQYVSNVVTVNVVAAKLQENKKEDIFLTLETEHYAVVGQKIHATLVCYLRKTGISIEKLTLPTIKDVRLEGITGPLHHEEVKINGLMYRKISWHFDITPQKEGELLVPAAMLEYAENKQTGYFFNMFSKIKKIYSNAHIIQVSPLPPTKEICHAIGMFTEFFSTLIPPFVKVNDAVSLKLQIKGEGNFLLPEGFLLQNIPSSLRFYAVDKKKEDGSYIFEYVIQPMQDGLVIIPEQQFTYFNINTKTYERLKTSPLELHIMPNPLLYKSKPISFPDVLEKEEKDNQIDQIKDKDMLMSQVLCITEEEFNRDSLSGVRYTISLFYFVMVLLLLFFPYFFCYVRQRNQYIALVCQKITLWCMILYYQIIIFFYGKKIDSKKMRGFFIKLIARYFACSQEMVYLYYERLGRKIEYHTGSRKQWEEFFQLLNQETYGTAVHEQKNMNYLLKEARLWLRVFLFL